MKNVGRRQPHPWVLVVVSYLLSQNALTLASKRLPLLREQTPTRASINPFPAKEFMLLMQLLQKAGAQRRLANQKCSSFFSTLLLHSMHGKSESETDIPWYLTGSYGRLHQGCHKGWERDVYCHSWLHIRKCQTSDLVYVAMTPVVNLTEGQLTKMFAFSLSDAPMTLALY